MTRIDFYLLGSGDPQSRRVTACKLIEKAFRQGHAVYLHTASDEETRFMDSLLWTFRQGSFVPHELYPGAETEAPVLIGHGAAPDAVTAPDRLTGVLVNLSPEIPAGFERFERVAELIDQDETVKQAGRRRYKAYQAQGYSIQTHQLDRTD